MSAPGGKLTLPGVIRRGQLANAPGVSAYVRAEQHVLDGMRDMLLETVKETIPATASEPGLELHGEAVQAPKLGWETLDDYRKRLQETPTKYSPWRGTTVGYKRILSPLVRHAWLYIWPGNSPYLEIAEVEKLQVFSSVSSKRFFVGVVTATYGAMYSDNLYQLRHGEPPTVFSSLLLTGYPSGADNGSTAEELSQLDADDWRSFLPAPVQGLFLTCPVTREEQLSLPTFHAILTYR